jgi:succinate dehydrogenase / fumarate reductase cytochrome b subunit
VLPLGAFLVFHLGVNVRALQGETAFAATLDALHRSRAWAVAEVLLVYVPLLLHAALGVWLVGKREPFVAPAPYPAPVLGMLRATGAVAAVFLVAHLVSLRFPLAGLGPDGGTLTTLLTSSLSSTRLGVPWQGVGTLFAVGCVAFHFVTGCWGVYARSAHGKADARRRRWAALGAGVVGVALGFGFADVAVFDATGVRLVGPRSMGDAPLQSCP